MSFKDYVLTVIKGLFCSKRNQEYAEPQPIGEGSTSTEKEVGCYADIKMETNTEKNTYVNNYVSVESLNALTRIWEQYGRLSVTLPEHTNLWHCGLIDSLDSMDKSRPLWCISDYGKRLKYLGRTKYDISIRNKGEVPYLLTLEVPRQLKMADFNSHRMGKFTEEFGNSHHNNLDEAMCKWGIINGFDGIVRVNEKDEIILFHPLKVISVTKIEPVI